MIKLHDLYTQTRLAAGDLGKRAYSDFEIRAASEHSVNMIEEACIKNFSNVLMRSAVIVLVDGVGKLPEGFLAIERVGDKSLLSPVDEFSIQGDEIHCNIDEEEIKITFHKSPQKNELEIDLPHNILFPLARLAANVLKEEFEAAAIKANEIALNTKSRVTGTLPDPDMWGA